LRVEVGEKKGDWPGRQWEFEEPRAQMFGSDSGVRRPVTGSLRSIKDAAVVILIWRKGGMLILREI
jgi:hypothetical protein